MTMQKSSNRISINLVQTAFPDYRQSFLEEMERISEGHFFLYCGDEYFSTSIVTNVRFDKKKRISNRFLLSRKLLFQNLPFGKLANETYCIQELNPRILSVWLLAVMRKLRRKPIIFWGHAWPRKGKDHPTDKLRQVMRKLADVIIVYTETDKTDLQQRMPNQKIVVAPNSIYQKAKMGFAQSKVRTDFIYVGRHVTSKKVAIAIEAYARILGEVPEGKLVLVGTGPQSDSLKEMAAKLLPPDRYEFPGHVADLETLRPLYAKSVASLSPGYIGLSATQSLGLGVPMIVSRDENHSPEIEAIQEGENGVFFDTDDAGSLAEAMRSMWNARDEWTERGPAISEDCALRYSTEAMAAGFMKAIACAQGKLISESL